MRQTTWFDGALSLITLLAFAHSAVSLWGLHHGLVFTAVAVNIVTGVFR